MNIPNRITVIRLILTPVIFLWFFSINCISGMSQILYSAILIILYATMEITDLVDGKIARSQKLVTDLGKVMDPFADVMSHMTFFVCFLSWGIMPIIPFMLIFWREFAQSFVRMLMMGKGFAMSANIFGKAKTCFYALASLGGFTFRVLESFNLYKTWMETTFSVLCILAALASVASFLIYIKDIIRSGVLKNMTR